MNRRNKRFMRLLSVILSASMLSVSAVYALSVNAVEFDDNEVQSMQTSEFVLPDIIDPNDEETADFVGRVYDEESDLNTFVFENSDGSHTMKVYSHPVKYEDEDGKIKDITLDLIRESDGSFVSTGNNIVTTFSRELADGIETVYDDLKITFIPELDEEQAESAIASYSEEDNKLTYKADEKISYQYSLTYTGYKEDIVVESYTDQTEYDFVLYTNGLSLNEDKGFWYLSNDNGDMCFNFGDVIIYSADGMNNTFGYMSSQTICENEKYVITIHVDEEYLRDEATVYPVRIDPTIIVNSGSGAIEGKTIFDDNTVTTSLIVGKTASAQKARFLLRFPYLDVSPIKSSLSVSSAKVELTNYEPDDNISVGVWCYQFDENWINTSTWGSLNQNEDYIYTPLSHKTISYSNGANNSPPHRYSFDIKQAVKRWVDEKDVAANQNYCAFSPDTGLIFKTASENSVTTKYKRFYSSLSSSNGPTLTIKYVYEITNNEFFSRYTSQKYNSDLNLSNYYETSLLRYRMNCYGYSVGYILNEKTQTGYRQQPGDFTSNPSSIQIPLVSEPYSEIMNKLIENMVLDSNRWGYTITQYNPTSSVVEQSTTGSRKIALVIGKYDNGTKYDFHFYMQHSDGTWSHKPGLDNVSNLSIDTEQLLTNENIMNLANQGKYVCQAPSGNALSNSQLRFFEISKIPTVDYPHGKKIYNTITTIYNNYEKGVNCIEGANNTTIAGLYDRLSQIDYAKDDDYCYFICTSPGNYTISTYYDINQFSGFVPNMHCEVYNNSGIPVASYTGTGNVSLNYYFSGGNKYVVRIWCNNTYYIGDTDNDTKTPFQYYLRIRSSD